MTIEFLPGYKTDSAAIMTVKKKTTINISVHLLSTDYVLSHLIDVSKQYMR